MKLLITGGAGFIGYAVIRYIIYETNHQVKMLTNLPMQVDIFCK